MKNINEIWIEVLFNGEPMDNIIADNEQEAEELIKSIEKYGFEEYNEDVKNDWLEMGFENNPKVTARISRR